MYLMAETKIFTVIETVIEIALSHGEYIYTRIRRENKDNQH